MTNIVSKSWVYTLNNPTDGERSALASWEVSYHVFGEEVGATGTPHIQGFVTWRRTYRLSALKKLLPRAHWEKAKTTDAANYCMKDGEFTIIDNRRKRGGKSTALKEAVTYLVEKKPTLAELWKEQPEVMVRHYKGMEMLLRSTVPVYQCGNYDLESFNREPLVFHGRSVVVLGPSGIGKTEYVLAHFKTPLFVTHTDDLQKLTEQHDGIVFDDMSFLHLPREAQIHLVDVAFTRSIHCRYMNAVIPKGVIRVFTANHPIFLDDPAINRRVDVVHVREKLF